MEHYSLKDAQSHLKKLLDEARQAKEILIVDENNQAVQLIPVTIPIKACKAGSARGQIKMSDDFDAPLSDFGEYIEVIC